MPYKPPKVPPDIFKYLSQTEGLLLEGLIARYSRIKSGGGRIKAGNKSEVEKVFEGFLNRSRQSEEPEKPQRRKRGFKETGIKGKILKYLGSVKGADAERIIKAVKATEGGCSEGSIRASLSALIRARKVKKFGDTRAKLYKLI